jgi:hypothetical protein
LAGAAEAQRERAGGSSGPGDVGVFFDAKALLVERFGEDRAEEMVAPGRLMDLADAVQLAMPQDDY